jgi:hypothetical protein
MTDPTEMIWADNPNLPGQRAYMPRGALTELAKAGWREGEPEPPVSTAELDKQILIAAGRLPAEEPAEPEVVATHPEGEPEVKTAAKKK